MQSIEDQKIKLAALLKRKRDGESATDLSVQDENKHSKQVLSEKADTKPEGAIAKPGKKHKLNKLGKKEPAQVESHSYTVLWAEHVLTRYQNATGPSLGGINTTGGNRIGHMHGVLKPGDVIFPLGVRNKKLFVYGKFPVTKTTRRGDLTLEDYIKWHEERGLAEIVGCYKPSVLIDLDQVSGIFKKDGRVVVHPDQLRWLRPNGQERSMHCKDGQIPTTSSLQGVFKLSPASAKVLTNVLKQPSEH